MRLIRYKSINNTTKEETILTSSIVYNDNSNNTTDFTLMSFATIYAYYIKELFINPKSSITILSRLILIIIFKLGVKAIN